MSNLVPFGKYKGQPVEALAQDRQYVDWLTAQPWFREKFAGLYTIIINNFAEPSETPAHNALQVLFLEDAFCARFITVLKLDGMKHFTNELLSARQSLIAKLEEVRRYGNEHLHYAARAREYEQALAAYAGAISWEIRFYKTFEAVGVDIQLDGWIRTTTMPRGCGVRTDFPRIQIEIKPAVGDDYPAVLRQCAATAVTCCSPKIIPAVAPLPSSFVQTFALSGMQVAFRRDVDAAQPGAMAGSLTLSH
jgi:hypothetical protein